MGLTWEDLTSPRGATLAGLVVASLLKHLWLRQARASREQQYTRVGTVASLHVYPIKSCGGVQPEPQGAWAKRTGLFVDGMSDRWWMIVSEDDKWIGMKKHPRLVLVTSRRDADWMVVSAPGMPPLRLPLNPSPAIFRRRTLSEKGTHMDVLDCGQEAHEWFTRYLGVPAYLVYSRPGIGLRDVYDTPRPWENKARKGDTMVFAAVTPYLLTTTSSLANLNQRMDQPVSSVNFRPNIVIENSVPFDEDNWDEIRIGRKAQFHYVEPCRRCKITTVDPVTGVMDSEMQPLSTLKAYREKQPYGKAPLFGAYLAVDREGHISVGDPVYAIVKQ